MYGTDGIPAVIVCCHGSFVAFMVKTLAGKFTRLQENIIISIQNAKRQAFKVPSAAEVAAILDKLEVDPDE